VALTALTPDQALPCLTLRTGTIPLVTCAAQVPTR
jgi:hypothetical protein